MTAHDPGIPALANEQRGVAEREQVAQDIRDEAAEQAARKRGEAKLTALCVAFLSKQEFMRWKGSIVALLAGHEFWVDVTARRMDAMARKLTLMGVEEREEVMRKTISDGANAQKRETPRPDEGRGDTQNQGGPRPTPERQS